MELTPGQRRLAFLVTVVVLAGLGAYLLFPGVRAPGHGPVRATPQARAAPHTPAGAAGAAGAATPSVAPAPTGSGAVDIYRWLPFSQSDLGKAAGVTQAFGADYGTFSYTESATDYVGRMQNLITSQLSATLARGYATAGVAQQRIQQKQVSTGSAVINSLRAFGTSSLTFVVTIKQTMTTKHGKGQLTGQYAVTVSTSGANWQVSDIQLASAGNF
jgi:hypothetical protein